MCHAWLLRSHHGPDGARAHTGYAYGHSARAELRPEPRYTRERGPCSSAAVAPTRGPEAPRESVGSQPYAQCRRRLRGDTATLLNARKRFGANDPETTHAHERLRGSGWRRAAGVTARQTGSFSFHCLWLSRFVCDGCVHPTWVSIIRALRCCRRGEWGFHTVSFSRRTKVVRGTRARRDHG